MEPRPPRTSLRPAFVRGGGEAEVGVPGTPCACAEGSGEGHSAGQSRDSFRKGLNERTWGPRRG